MLRQMLLFPVKLPFRVARKLYRMVNPKPAPYEPPQAPEPPPVKPDSTGPGPRDVQIAPEDIFALREKGELVTFVDVREPMELSSGIVAGAILMPSGQVGAKFQTLPKDGTLVLYCASGMRSTNAALFLHGQGYPNARSLIGGFAHWVRDNGEVAHVESA